MKLAKWIWIHTLLTGVLLCCCAVQTVPHQLSLSEKPGSGAGMQHPARVQLVRQDIQETLELSGFKGGVIVHLGCGNGERTIALHTGDNCIVQGLDTSGARVRAAREYINSKGIYGNITAIKFDGRTLPYTDNMVNLLVVDEIYSVPRQELMRVLCPNGVAYIRNNGRWTKIIKPWPNEIDEWTHFLHGADNNAVSHDTLVGPPHHIQWQGKPKFARAHEQLASLSACVTAGGRVFYIIDEAPRSDVRFPSQWFLVARDAFNGVVLWKKPMGSWADQLRRFRSGPPDLAFRLVARKDRLYVTLAIDAPVSVLDTATGDTLWVYNGTEDTRQILRVADKLILLIDTAPQTTNKIDSEIRRGLIPAPGIRTIIVADASANNIIWRREIESFVHPTLAVQNSRLFYHTKAGLFCRDIDTGRELWNVPIEIELKGHEVGWESPTLVVQDDVVYSADFKRIIAFSVEDGRQLWDGSSWPGYNSPPDVFVIDDLLWTKDKGTNRIGFDPVTGTPKREISSKKGYMHHRCYRNKATDRFIILGNQGVQFLDIKSGEIWQNYWIRGTCQYGIMPANGFLYITPDSCACNLNTKLKGFFALAADREPVRKSRNRKDVRFEKGPAYGQVSKTVSALNSEDWPMYRHDPTRSGMTPTKVAARFKPLWRTNLGEKLSSVVVADGRLFVASIDTHKVHALDDSSGNKLWNYTVGGRVDSPPNIYNGMVLFGSADGWVYALRAKDGKLVWRFRAAPEPRQVFVNGQLESVWPVQGSVLVKDGVLIVAAGRSSYLDGGIRLYRLEPETGRQIAATVIYSPDPQKQKQPPQSEKEMPGVLSDILSTDGENVYMRQMKLDFKTANETGKGVHLFTPIGLLDDTWWHRGYWVVNDEFRSHWSGWWQVGNKVPSGRILSYNESSVYGFGRDRYHSGNTGQWRGGEKYHLFAYDRNSADKGTSPGRRQASRTKKLSALSTLEYRWTKQVPLLVSAMVVADETMFIAGRPDIIKTEESLGEGALKLENPQQALAAWQGKKGALLWAVSVENGKKLAEHELESLPVFDGMAAANGRLYISTQDGHLLCMGK